MWNIKLCFNASLYKEALGDFSEFRRLLTPMGCFSMDRMPFATWRSTEVPSVRSAQQKFDFTSTQRGSILVGPMFDPPPHVPPRITAFGPSGAGW